MAERSTITQAVQIGVETTSGTPVAAPKRLGSMGFTLGPAIDAKPLRPDGQKYATLQIIGKEWSEGKISGMPVYTELPYALASIMSAPTVTAVQDGGSPTGATKWVFDSSTFNADAPKTYTLEQGSSVRAHRIAGLIFQEYSWKWSREQIELGGKVFGKALEDGITMSSSPTLLPQVPVRPSELSLYIDSAAAGLGTTKQTRALKGEMSIGDRFDPLWVVDAANPSYVAIVETEPTVEWKITQEADAQGMANLTALRAGGTQFIRLEAVGPNIYTGTGGTPLIVNHKVTLDLAGQINDISSLDDEDGVYGVEWTFSTVHDPTWGKAYHAEVVTTTATL
jgi:hypothetical protein